MPVDLPPVDDSGADVPPERAGRVWQSDPSDDDVVFVRFRDETTQVEITTRDMDGQTSTWESYSNGELNTDMCFCLSAPSFSMITNVPIPFRQDYHRRIQYKAAGATYDGTSQTWSMPLGRDLRNVLTMTPEWVENAEMLKRSILLHIIKELDRGSGFI